MKALRIIVHSCWLLAFVLSDNSLDIRKAHRHLTPLDQIWTSTGFCPPNPHQNFKDYIQLDFVKQNIKLIGGLPYAPQTFQIRIHWLLNLVSLSNEGYDFQFLDQLIDLCTGHGLSIGFELMGNPSSYFSDFENSEQIHMWYRLVHETGNIKITLSYGYVNQKASIKMASVYYKKTLQLLTLVDNHAHVVYMPKNIYNSVYRSGWAQYEFEYKKMPAIKHKLCMYVDV